MKRSMFIAAALFAAATSRTAAAQPDDKPDSGEVTEIEVPTLVVGEGGSESTDDTGDIDLANIVQSAARAVTTVQEAPAIVTVITEDEIKERRVRTLADLVDSVPGFMRVDFEFGQFPHPAARGQVQATQFLQDGISMFEPFVNVATVSQVLPMELAKRVEVITGPGGVLWGSNSLLGIVNEITKDAEDVDGVEVGVTGGDGPGDRNYLHGYVMAGKEHLLGKSSDSKLLIHGGFTTYQGAALQVPTHMFSSPLPQPNSNDLYGPLTTADPKQSFIFTVFAKLSLGKNVQVRVFAPYAEKHLPIGFPGDVVRKSLPEDSRPNCQDLSTGILVGNDDCADKGKTARDDRLNNFDRYAVLEYKTRTGGGKAGISAKAYITQFVRDFQQVQVLAPIDNLLEGGLAFHFNATTYRPGAQIDGDFELPHDTRVLYGVEAFHEFARNNTTRSRQGTGIAADFIAPYNLSLLPLPCPLTTADDGMGGKTIVPIAGCPLTFAFPSSRTVFGAYLAPEWRPVKKLILDAGARVQVSPPSLGVNSYALTPTFAASAVYNFITNWHLKANFTQGFRPPVFNNLNSNGEAVQLDGSPDLKVETTNAAQAEINARLFKGQRRVRELDFRLDYSYTKVQNLIQLVGGRYKNTADRGINSAEFLGTLYIQGGHKLELGYTWLRSDTADKGQEKSLPENWFNLMGVFNIVDGKLSASTNLRVLGAMEDPNRLVEYRDMHYCGAAEANAGTCMEGDIVLTQNGQTTVGTPLSTSPVGLVMDRIPPSAELSAGLTYTPTSKLTIDAEVFNALNGRFYQSDLFGDYEPRLEFVPNPEADIRAYLSATYAY